jgi:multisubunit Na+/H+ antiporter MnhB subunit
VIEFLVRPVVLSLLLAVVGTVIILLLTSRRSLVRMWLFASSDRIMVVGIGAAVLLWTGIAVFNRLGP